MLTVHVKCNHGYSALHFSNFLIQEPYLALACVCDNGKTTINSEGELNISRASRNRRQDRCVIDSHARGKLLLLLLLVQMTHVSVSVSHKTSQHYKFY